MNTNRNEQAAIFLLGTAIGTSIGLILATVFNPQPFSFSQSGLSTSPQKTEDPQLLHLNSPNTYSTRIKNATTQWINQLRAITDDLVATGQMHGDEADKQINELLLKVQR